MMREVVEVKAAAAERVDAMVKRFMLVFVSRVNQSEPKTIFLWCIERRDGGTT